MQGSSRKNPLAFDSLALALLWTRAEHMDVWAKILGRAGVYHVYPGRRVAYYPARASKDPGLSVAGYDEVE